MGEGGRGRMGEGGRGRMGEGGRGRMGEGGREGEKGGGREGGREGGYATLPIGHYHNRTRHPLKKGHLFRSPKYYNTFLTSEKGHLNKTCHLVSFVWRFSTNSVLWCWSCRPSL